MIEASELYHDCTDTDIVCDVCILLAFTCKQTWLFFNSVENVISCMSVTLGEGTKLSYCKHCLLLWVQLEKKIVWWLWSEYIWITMLRKYTPLHACMYVYTGIK